MGATLEPLGLGSNTGRTEIRIAVEGLNTANGQHETTSACGVVGAGGQGDSQGATGPDLSRSTESDLITQPVLDELVFGEHQGV